MFRTLGMALRQLLLPAHCAACGTAAAPSATTPLCGACAEAMDRLVSADYCPRCGRGTGPHAGDETGCARCRHRRVPYDGVARVGAYESPLRRLILDFKYRRRRDLGAVLGRWLAEHVASAEWVAGADLVVPVPLHWSRRLWRGFNQAEGLAAALAAGTPDRRLERRLLRARPTPHQTRLPVTRRAANVRGAFGVRGPTDGVQGRRILLVDDVLTSGSTAAECARVLKRAGAAAVFVAVAAVAEPDEAGPW